MDARLRVNTLKVKVNVFIRARYSIYVTDMLGETNRTRTRKDTARYVLKLGNY